MSTPEGPIGTVKRALGGLTDYDSKWLVLMSIVLTVAVLVVVPLVFLLWTSVWSGFPGQSGAEFTLGNFRAVYTGDLFDVSELFLNSLIIAVVATLVSTVSGLAFAWLFVRTNLPTKGALELVLLSGHAVPGYIYAFMYLTAYAPDSGLVSSLLARTVGAGIPLAMTDPWGVGFVIGVTIIPTFYLLIVPALQDMDPALEEVSRVHGASIRGTVRSITVPLIKPALLSGAVVVFLYGLGEFSVVAILGIRGGFDVYSTKIHEAIRIGIRREGEFLATPAYGEAAALACSLLLVMFVLVWYYRSVTSRKEDYMTLTGQRGQRRTWDLGKWRWPAALTLWAVLLFVWIVPVAVLALASVHANWTGGLELSALTVEHYATAVTDARIRQAFTNSVLVAVGGASLGTVLVVGLSYYTERTAARFRGLVDFLSLSPLAVPGIILGSGILFTFLWIGNVAPPLSLYGTLGIIIIGCVVVFIPVTSRIAIGNVVQIHSELEEAARVSGATWLQQMRSIFLPLFRNTAVVIWFFLAVNVFQLLSIPAMTYTADTVVIPIRLFQMYTYDPNIEVLAAISTVFVGLTMLVVLALRSAGITFYELGQR
jgi:iron(III) transport system permease protein